VYGEDDIMREKVVEYRFPVPREPAEIKEGALKMCSDPSWSFLERDRVINLFTLSANYLPKYLWREWKKELKERGIPWQLFLKAISACDHDVVRWVEGILSWEDLVGIIEETLMRASSGRYPLKR
jgi:hypothetical protein